MVSPFKFWSLFGFCCFRFRGFGLIAVNCWKGTGRVQPSSFFFFCVVAGRGFVLILFLVAEMGMVLRIAG